MEEAVCLFFSLIALILMANQTIPPLIYCLNNVNSTFYQNPDFSLEVGLAFAISRSEDGVA